MISGWARFCRVSEESDCVQDLANASRKLTIPAGATLISQGDQTNIVYLLLDGRLRAVNLSKGGDQVWLANIEPFDLVGEISALTGRPRTCSVVAGSESVVLSIPGETFVQMFNTHGALSRALSMLLIDRLQMTTSRLTERKTKDLEKRLHSELVRVGTPCSRDDRFVRVCSNEWKVRILSERIHATREASYRALKSLKEKGKVYVDQGSWVVRRKVD